MADRTQVRDLNLDSPLRPVAEPVDTYYRPTAKTVNLETGGADVEGGGTFRSLAESIGAVTPVIQREISEWEKLRQEEAVKEGAVARIKNQKSFKDAQAAGMIRPAENPWFVKGYLQQDGRLSGANYREALMTAWGQSPAKNSDNLGDFQKFQGDFRNKWIQENDGKTPDWMDGFAPKMQQADNELSARHVAHRMKVLEDTQEQNTEIEVNKILAAQKDRELQAGNDPDLIEASRPAVANELSVLASDLVRKGMDGSKVNKIITDQANALGVEFRDPSFARSVIKDINTGSGKLGDTTYAKQKLEASENHIRSVNRQEKLDAWRDEDRPFEVENRNHAVQARAQQVKTWEKQAKSEIREERIQGLTSDISNQIRVNGVIDPNKLALLNKEDWRAAAQMEDYQRTRQVRAQEIIPDQHAASQMNERIATNPESVREHDIWAGVRPGGWTYEQARTMSNELQQRMNSPARGILKNNLDYKNLDTSLNAAVSKNMEAARTGAGEAEAGRARIRFRKIAEDIYSGPGTEGEKAVALDEAYLKELERSNKIAKGLMNPGGVLEVTPTPAEAKAEREKTARQQEKAAEEARIKAEEAKYIPAHHVKRLLENYNDPDAKAAFDAKYGPGASVLVGTGGMGGRYLKERK
jgi:hypothetical protein